MKSMTEFPNFKLLQGLKAKEELTAAGKTPEEIQQSLGETFKLEGEKLTYFTNAMEVASQNLEKLSRIKVISLSEGESTPPKAVKMEEFYYVPEFMVPPLAPNMLGKQANKKNDKKKGGPKESPWGLSPEQLAAKKGAGAKGAKPASN